MKRCCGRRRLRQRASRSAVLAGALLVSTGVAWAQAAPGDASDTPAIEYRPWTDGPVTAAAVAAWALPDLLQRPAPCRWCERSADGRDTLNRLDASARRAFRWRDPKAADGLSDSGLSLSIAVPLGILLASHGDLDEGFGRDVLVVLEATAISGALTQGAKYLLRRERPWAHFEDVPPDEEPGSPSSTLSFFSGHTSIAFAVVASSGSLASIRGDRAAPWIWGTGLAMASLTGYLRIAADRHYLSDVLVGAAVGTAAGLAVPHLMHKGQSRPDLQDAPLPEPASPMLGMRLGRRASGDGGVMVGAGLQRGAPFLSVSWSW